MKLREYVGGSEGDGYPAPLCAKKLRVASTKRQQKPAGAPSAPGLSGSRTQNEVRFRRLNSAFNYF